MRDLGPGKKGERAALSLREGLFVRSVVPAELLQGAAHFWRKRAAELQSCFLWKFGSDVRR